LAAPAAAAVVVNPVPVPVPTADKGPEAKRGPSTGLLAGGLALFAVGYGATIGINFGVCGSGATWNGCDSKGLSFVPVVGPFIFAGIENTEASYRALAVTLGLTQAAGALLFGLSFAGGSGDSAKTAYVVPAVSRDGGGATVVGTF
jgi:hypothetical protein